MAGMTKQRYVMIAETINKQRTDAHGNKYGRQVQDVITDVAAGLADAFAKDNDQFRRGWFLAIAGAVKCEACGDTLDSYGRSATFLATPPEQSQNGDSCPRTKSGQHVPSEPL